MSRYTDDADRLRRELSRYAAAYPHESPVVRRFLKLLAEGRRAFDREHAAGHFTASALVFTPDLRRVLLTHHRKLDIWVQLGGHADGDANLPRAALREATEESGLADIRAASKGIIDIDIHPIPAYRSDPPHDHYDVRYAFIADPERPLVVSDESHDLAWVPVDRLGDFSREASLHRAVGKALRVVATDRTVGNR